MSGFENAADNAIYDALAANATLTALLSGGTASPSVFRAVAPQNTDPPYVVFHAQSPSTPVWKLGGLAWENALYACKAVTLSKSAALAGTIGTLIQQTLGGTATPAITGYEIVDWRRVQNIDYPEVAPGGQVYQHRGAIFRIKAHPA